MKSATGHPSRLAHAVVLLGTRKLQVRTINDICQLLTQVSGRPSSPAAKDTMGTTSEERSPASRKFQISGGATPAHLSSCESDLHPHGV